MYSKKIPLLAFGTPSAGKPARRATGNNTAPKSATAGDGQKNHEINPMESCEFNPHTFSPQYSI